MDCKLHSIRVLYFEEGNSGGRQSIIIIFGLKRFCCGKVQQLLRSKREKKKDLLMTRPSFIDSKYKSINILPRANKSSYDTTPSLDLFP